MNSNEPESQPTTPTPTTSPSPDVASDSVEYNEAPLSALPPGKSVIAPPKPLREMSDQELQEWHSHLCEHRQHMVMVAHLNAAPKKKSEKAEPQRDISEYE